MIRNLLLFLIVSLFAMSCKDDKSNLNQIDLNTLEPEPIVVKDSVLFTQPDWVKNAIIYELNVRNYSKEGTFKKVEENLLRLKALGVNIIHLMPIQSIGSMNRIGALGDVRAIKDYQKINKDLGSLDDFKSLVNKAHALGIKVIIEWENSHVSIDNKSVKSHPELYFKDTVASNVKAYLDSTSVDLLPIISHNEFIQDKMQEDMLYWLKDTDIDGFACKVDDSIPMDYWIQTRKKLEEVKPVFLIAHSKEEKYNEVFNARYAIGFKDLIVEIANENKDFNLISDYFYQLKSLQNPNDLLIYYTTNTIDNRNGITEFKQLSKYTENYNVLTFAMGGMPLIYNGQEAGVDKQLSLYDKDSIEWRDYSREGFFKKLSSLYMQNDVLWNNTSKDHYEIINADKDVFFFIRYNNNERMAFLQNYSNFTQYVSLTSVNGMKTKLNLLTNEPTIVTERGIEIPPYSTVIIGQ